MNYFFRTSTRKTVVSKVFPGLKVDMSYKLMGCYYQIFIHSIKGNESEENLYKYFSDDAYYQLYDELHQGIAILN